MKKIPTALVRNPKNRAKVLMEVTPSCEWVFLGEGRPTRKWNGTCVMFDGVSWWARREVKPGKGAPEGYIEVDHDPMTGKTQGWEPIEQSSFAKFHSEALDHAPAWQWAEGAYPEGTYELVGPKINGNEDNLEHYMLMRHANAPLIDELDFPFKPLTVALVLEVLCKKTGIEGVVWHHPDGRMAKLKARDL